MASRGTGAAGGAGTRLPEVVPFDLANSTRLSWELGARVVDDGESTLHSEWRYSESPWELSLFHVTSETVAVRVRTPAGRERFYGAARMDLESVLPSLETATGWYRHH